MSVKQRLLDAGYEGVKYFVNPSYDDVLIGVSARNQAVYDYEKMIKYLMQEEGMGYEEAVEWLEYNTVCAYFGEDTPVIVYSM